MFDVTPAAVDALRELLDDSGSQPEECFRITESGGQLAFSVDREAAGDKAFRDEERTILVVDQEMSEALEGATLDFGSPTEGAAEQFMLATG